MQMSKRICETPAIEPRQHLGFAGRCLKVVRVAYGCRQWFIPSVQQPNLFVVLAVGGSIKATRDYLTTVLGDKTVKVITATVVAGVTYWHVKSIAKTWVLSKTGERTLSKLVDRVSYRNPNMREPFYQQLSELPLIKMAFNHTHRKSAELRSSVNYYLKNMVTAMGYTPYCVSNASSDSKADGSRYYYCAKDLKLAYRDDKITSRHILIFTDVDYHAPMNEYLKLFVPMVLFTLYPTNVAGHTSEYAFKICDDKVVYHVAGGASYEHNIWDYDSDVVTVIDDEWNLCVYDVTMTSLDFDKHRRIITLFPAVKVPWPFYRFLSYNDGIKYKKFSTVVGDIIINSIYDPILRHVSVGLNDSHNSVELSSYLFEGLKNRLEVKRSPPMIADIERLLIADNVKSEKNGSGIIHDDTATQASLLFRVMVEKFKLVKNNVPTYKMSCGYQTIGFLKTEDGDETGRMFTHSLAVKPALFPNRSVNNDVSTIQGRINKVQNKVKPPARFVEYAASFVNTLVGDQVAVGKPMSYDQVVEQQNRPTQRARTLIVENTLSPNGSNQLQSFQKVEAYNGTNDPRNITTCSTQLTIGMSCFTYPFKENVFKKLSCYGPGLSPLQTVNKLGSFCTGDVLTTDYTRLDGSVSEWLQFQVVRAMYMRYFSDEHKPELSRWFKECFRQRATTSQGIQYDPGFGTRSGSPITTDGNTAIGLFVDYAALRELGNNHQQAWDIMCRDHLGFGDDGAKKMREGLDKSIKETAQHLGLIIKTDIINDGYNVPYLGRIFVQPSLCPDSYQDPKRTIPKLHLTSNKQVSIEQAAYNKVMGYLATDKLTPVISDYCNKVVSLLHISEVQNATHEEMFKINMAWPQEDAEKIRASFCDYMGISSIELKTMVDCITMVDSLESFTAVWDNANEHPDKIAAVTPDDLVGPTDIKHITNLKELKCPQITQNNCTRPIINGSKVAQTTLPSAWNNILPRQTHGRERESRFRNGIMNKSKSCAKPSLRRLPVLNHSTSTPLSLPRTISDTSSKN